MVRRLLALGVTAFLGFGAAMMLGFTDELAESATQVVPSLVGASAVVVRVIDGDTLEVRVSGRRDRVRILGIDSPEMRPKERCATQATEAARRLAQGKTVNLRTDRTQATRDCRREAACFSWPGRHWSRSGWVQMWQLRGMGSGCLSFRVAASWLVSALPLGVGEFRPGLRT